jgi:hypothetical protein
MMNWMLFKSDRTKHARMYVRGSEMTHGLPMTATVRSESGPPNKTAELRVVAKPASKWRTPARAAAAVVFLACLVCASPCLANPSQDEVFKSISSNVDSQGSAGSGMFLAVIVAIAGVVLIAAVWKNRTAGPARGTAPLNNQGKLIKELMKATGLKPGQMRQLRVLADDLEVRGQVLGSPLTLLLCPSLLRKAKEEIGER